LEYPVEAEDECVVEDEAPRSLFAQAPKLRAAAAMAMIARYFMVCVCFPSFLSQQARAAIFDVCRSSTTLFCRT
jgi:hypothetical protein